MNCNTTHYRANSSSVPGDPTILAFERSTQHIPLYVAEALIVELVAARVGRHRQLTLGAVAGGLIGTVGFASEWGWSHIWMPLPWTTDLLPEGLVLAAIAGTAGGVLGGFIGRAVAPDGVGHQPTPRFAGALAWVGVVAVLGLALPLGESAWTADLDLTSAGTDPATGAPLADISVDLDADADAAADGAAWFVALAWQGAADGGPGGFEHSVLERGDDGRWHTQSPIPVGGDFKSMLRLHSGSGMQAVPIFLPADDALDASEVPAQDGPRQFQREKAILQREAITDNVALERAAYAALAMLAALWMVTLSWGLRRLDPSTGSRRPAAETRRAPTVPHAERVALRS